MDLSPTWGVNPLAGHMGGRLYFVTQSQLRRANTVRLYLRVITLADLCNPTGNYIPSSMLNGDWQAGSDLLWPFQPQPPKSYFATFRRLIRLSFSRNTPVHHHYLDSLNLDTPLGKWLPVPRNTWFPVYRAQDELYWRQKDDDTLFVLVKSPTLVFFHFSHTTTTLPLDCHPITYQQIGHSLWTQRKYRPHVPTARVPPPPGHIVSNTLSDADPCNEQHGFRPNRSSIDAGFLKLLTFECSRIQRSTTCMVQHDMTAHFDRMYPAMTSIYASRYKVDRNILLSIGKTIRCLKRNVETALGVSKTHYKQLPGAPAIGGMVQGKADVPQLSTQQSDAMLKDRADRRTNTTQPNRHSHYHSP